MTCGSIYKIIFPNGKHYIGLTTTSIEQRTKQHKKSAKNGAAYYVYNAIRKHEMVDTLELVKIDTAYTIEELCEKEIDYIQKYNSYYIHKKGYNMTLGGEGTNGYVYTEEAREQMSERKRKYFKDNPDAREQMSKRMKKYLDDNPDAREQMSKRMKQYLDDNPKAAKEHGERLKKHYEDHPEVKQKCSYAQKKRFKNIEERRKISKKRWQHNQFDVFTIDGTYIKTFTYHFEAVEYLQTEYNITTEIRIGAVLAGKRNSSAGFVFKYK